MVVGAAAYVASVRGGRGWILMQERESYESICVCNGKAVAARNGRIAMTAAAPNGPVECVDNRTRECMDGRTGEPFEPTADQSEIDEHQMQGTLIFPLL